MLEFADVNIDFFGSKLLLDWDWDWDWDKDWDWLRDWDRGRDGDVEKIEEEEIDWTIFIIDSEEDVNSGHTGYFRFFAPFSQA